MSRPQFINIEAFGDISGKNLEFLRDLETVINKHLIINDPTFSPVPSRDVMQNINSYLYGELSMDELLNAVDKANKDMLDDIKADNKTENKQHDAYDFWHLARTIVMPPILGGLTVKEINDIWHTPFYGEVFKMDPDDAMSIYEEWKRSKEDKHE